MVKVANFERKPGETLEAFIKRAASLAQRVVSNEQKRVLANNILCRMADGEQDTRLRDCVIDRLFAKGKLV